MTKAPQTIEEGIASLFLATDDKTVDEAARGEHGEKVRLLSLGEKVRRDRSKASTRRSAA